jgi:hypothetical protein
MVMKTLFPQFFKIQSMALLIFMLVPFLPVKSAEFVIMNRVISWDVNSGDAFWTIPVDSRWPTNWIYPNDYYHGKIYTRYEVLSVATSEPFGMQFGIFQWQPNAANRDSCGEMCELVRPLQGAGDVAISSSSPSTWWTSHGGVDFSRVVADFQSMSAIIYAADPNWPVSPPANGGDPAGLAWSQRFNWFPVTIRVTVVAVSTGSTFSGWGNYIINPNLRKATPTYGIDYINETTDKAVPSTDEYSQYPTMSGALSGNGQKIPVPPGQRLYFRTKAADGKLASEIQILVVPIRPSTPVFILDQVNHRTTTAVSSDYEYCDFTDMADAVTGDGTNVDIPAGTTKYFCKKATGSSFRSKAQALNESAKEPLAHEFVIFNNYADFPNNSDTNGFYYFYYNADMPVNWKSPENYYGGMIYIRYEIVSVKTPTQIGLQFGIWQMTPPETGELHETMSQIEQLSGSGSVAYSSGSLSVGNDFWSLDNNLDFTRMNLTWHMGILPWKVNPSDQQIRQENPTVWDIRNTYWFPMKVRVTVVAVASGYNFSGWSNYMSLKPAAPSYSIDYAAEKTNQVITATDEYSYSPTMSPAYQGTGTALDIQPGQTIYFRTKAQGINSESDIQRLIVPARPAAPSVSIDFEQEKTVQNISADIEYSTSASFTSPSVGTGNQIAVTPGQELFFRQKSSNSSFSGEILHLAVPEKILLGYTGADTITDNKFTVYAILNDVIPALSLDNIVVTNGSAQNLQNGNTFDVYPVSEGSVSVIIPVNTLANGNFASNEVNVYYNKIVTGIPDLSENGFLIYPNPSQTGIINVKTKLNLSYTVGIYSVDGNLIRSFKMNNSDLQQINLQNLQKGLYFLKIRTTHDLGFQKLVLK